MKKALSLLLAILMTVGMLAGCSGNQPGTESTGSTGATGTPSTDGVTPEIVKEAPMLQEMVASGKIPALEERIPSGSDVYVEEKYSPTDETPVYGGTLRTPDGGMWYYGPICEEPLFRLLDDGTVEANVAKGYDISPDGLTYTIYLREGMKWSDGTPCVTADPFEKETM